MEFRDLKSQYLFQKNDIDKQIQEVIDSTAFISGKKVKELEDCLAEYVGVKHCISCANGTDALELSLMALGVGRGDAVFVPDFTFFSSGETVATVGATPIFVDIDEKTFNISIESLNNAINFVKEKTELIPRVIIPVDLFGLPADYPEIKKIADRSGLLILEDGAQGFGGKINDKKACSFGDISTTSFFPAKPLGCYGDGGAIFTDNDEWAEMLQSLKVHGKGYDKYDNVRIGMNSRLDTIQAGILLSKMKYFDKEIIKCNMIASLYRSHLDSNNIICPSIPQGYYSSWAQYTILLKDKDKRDIIIETLKKHNIPSMVYYRKPMHRQPAFDAYHEYNDKLSYCHTDNVCERCLSLPMSAYVKETEVITITEIINEIAGE